MSNIDKQAVTAKTKELSSLMVERFSMNPVSCKLLNEAWKKEFPDEMVIAKRMLALLDELEAAEKRNAEMSESNRLLCADSMIKQDRIAELEARKVKIKLPESFYPDGDIDCPLVINEYQIIEAIVAADCKPIAVCPRCKRELDLSHKPDGAHFCHPDAAGKGE